MDCSVLIIFLLLNRAVFLFSLKCDKLGQETGRKRLKASGIFPVLESRKKPSSSTTA